jgi:hypothetical protein
LAMAHYVWLFVAGLPAILGGCAQSDAIVQAEQPAVVSGPDTRVPTADPFDAHCPGDFLQTNDVSADQEFSEIAAAFDRVGQSSATVRELFETLYSSAPESSERHGEQFRPRAPDLSWPHARGPFQLIPIDAWAKFELIPIDARADVRLVGNQAGWIAPVCVPR